MGGAAAGVSEDNAAITVNPGLLGLHERYDLHGHFRYGPDSEAQWGVSAVDGRTSRWLTLGLYYAGDRGNPPLTPAELPGWTLPGEDPANIKRHHNLTLAMAVDGLDRRFGFGISGTFSVYDNDRQGQGSTGNVDAGFGGRPTEWLDLGVAGRNLIPVNDIGELPLTVVGGFRVHGKPGALIGDFEWRETSGNALPYTVASGFELPAGNVPRIRAGYRYEGPIDTHNVTGGVGFVGDTGSFDLGAQVPVGPGQPTLSGLGFLVSITMHAPTAEDPVGF